MIKIIWWRIFRVLKFVVDDWSESYETIKLNIPHITDGQKKFKFARIYCVCINLYETRKQIFCLL